MQEPSQIVTNKELKKSTALHRAILAVNLSEVIRLLTAGHDIEAMDENGMRPIHLAAQLGDKKILQELLNKGASVHAKANGKTVRQLAAPKVKTLIANAYKTENKTVKKNNNQSSQPTAEDLANLITYIKTGRLNLLEKMFKQNLNVEALFTARDNEKNYDPMQLAAYYGDAEIFTFLMMHQSLESAMTYTDNNSPFRIAIKENKEDIVKIIINQNFGNFNRKIGIGPNVYDLYKKNFEEDLDFITQYASPEVFKLVFEFLKHILKKSLKDHLAHAKKLAITYNKQEILSYLDNIPISEPSQSAQSQKSSAAKKKSKNKTKESLQEHKIPNYPDTSIAHTLWLNKTELKAQSDKQKVDKENKTKKEAEIQEKLAQENLIRHKQKECDKIISEGSSRNPRFFPTMANPSESQENQSPQANNENVTTSSSIITTPLEKSWLLDPNIVYVKQNYPNTESQKQLPEELQKVLNVISYAKEEKGLDLICIGGVIIFLLKLYEYQKDQKDLFLKQDDLSSLLFSNFGILENIHKEKCQFVILDLMQKFTALSNYSKNFLKESLRHLQSDFLILKKQINDEKMQSCLKIAKEIKSKKEMICNLQKIKLNAFDPYKTIAYIFIFRSQFMQLPEEFKQQYNVIFNDKFLDSNSHFFTDKNGKLLYENLFSIVEKTEGFIDKTNELLKDEREDKTYENVPQLK